jgi:hypothetical protein
MEVLGEPEPTVFATRVAVAEPVTEAGKTPDAVAP